MEKYKKTGVLLLIVLINVIGCVYALKWHAVYKEDKLNTTIITDYIHELKKEEFSNYIDDNPYAVIYFGVTSDDNCRSFEREFKKYIINNNLRETIVYINVNDLVGNDFGTKMDTLYNTKSMRENNRYMNVVPTVAIYDHNTLVDFASGTDLKVESVKKLLNKYNINGE